MSYCNSNQVFSHKKSSKIPPPTFNKNVHTGAVRPLKSQNKGDRKDVRHLNFSPTTAVLWRNRNLKSSGRNPSLRKMRIKLGKSRILFKLADVFSTLCPTISDKGGDKRDNWTLLENLFNLLYFSRPSDYIRKRAVLYQNMYLSTRKSKVNVYAM